MSKPQQNLLQNQHNSQIKQEEKYQTSSTVFHYGNFKYHQFPVNKASDEGQDDEPTQNTKWTATTNHETHQNIIQEQQKYDLQQQIEQTDVKLLQNKSTKQLLVDDDEEGGKFQQNKEKIIPENQSPSPHLKESQINDEQKQVNDLTFNELFTKREQTLRTNLSKIQKWKSLLPYYYQFKLNDDQKQLLQIGSTLDKVLKEQKKAGSMVNVQNFLNIVIDSEDGLMEESCFKEEQQSRLWNLIKRINYLQPNFYKLCEDPLSNLAIGFATRHVRLQTRKQKLRKSLVDYLLEKGNGEDQEKQKQSKSLDFSEIPCQDFQKIGKVSRFYPEVVSSIENAKQKQPSDQHSQKKIDEFKCLLKQSIHKSQNIHSSLIDSSNPTSMSTSTAVPIFQSASNSNNDFTKIKFQRRVRKIFKQKKVTNMYRSSLIELLCSSLCDISLKKIVNAVEYLCGQMKFIRSSVTKQGLILVHLALKAKRQQKVSQQKGQTWNFCHGSEKLRKKKVVNNPKKFIEEEVSTSLYRS